MEKTKVVLISASFMDTGTILFMKNLQGVFLTNASSSYEYTELPINATNMKIHIIDIIIPTIRQSFLKE